MESYSKLHGTCEWREAEKVKEREGGREGERERERDGGHGILWQAARYMRMEGGGESQREGRGEGARERERERDGVRGWHLR